MPALIAMGERAREQCDFTGARKYFRAAMRKSTSSPNGKSYVVRIAIGLATTYFDEIAYDPAEAWYKRALNLSVLLNGEYTMQAACLLVKLAELNTLKGKFDEVQELSKRAQHAYLLCDNTNIDVFLNCLVDLSWALCVTNRASNARDVNNFIAQVKEELTPDPTCDEAMSDCGIN